MRTFLSTSVSLFLFSNSDRNKCFFSFPFIFLSGQGKTSREVLCVPAISGSCFPFSHFFLLSFPECVTAVCKNNNEDKQTHKHKKAKQLLLSMPCEVTCSTSPHSVAEEPRFIMDFSMHRVAKYFRLLGYDTVCSRNVPQSDLLDVACAEHRIVVTSSRPLLRTVEVHNRRLQATRKALPATAVTRHVVAYDSDGDSIYSEDEAEADVLLRCLFTEQWRSCDFNRAICALIRQAGLTYDPLRVFSRCVTCNDFLVPVAKKEVKGRVVEKIYDIYDDFTECPTCRKVFWGVDGENVINYKSFRTLNRLRSLCISAGAPVEEERTRLTRLRCFRSFPRLTKVLVFSFLEDADIESLIEVFPPLRDLADEVHESRRTGQPVRKLQLRKGMGGR